MKAPEFNMRLEEDQKAYWLKYCEYNNEDKNSSSNILSDKNKRLEFEVHHKSTNKNYYIFLLAS